MSVPDDARAFIAHARTLQAGWRETATFIDRVEEARDKDADKRALQGFLTRAAMLAETIRRVRLPTLPSLAPPPELAHLFEPHPADASLDRDPDDYEALVPRFVVEGTLPGDWDVEVAVRAVGVGALLRGLGVGEVPDAELIGNCGLVPVAPGETLFEQVRPTDERMVVTPLVAPANLPAFPEHAELWFDADTGYFPRSHRVTAAQEGRWVFVTTAEAQDEAGIAENPGPPRPFSSLFTKRRATLNMNWDPDAETVGLVGAAELATLAADLRRNADVREAVAEYRARSNATQRLFDKARAVADGLVAELTDARPTLSGLDGFDAFEPALQAVQAGLASIAAAQDTVTRELARQPLTADAAERARLAAQTLASDLAHVDETTLAMTVASLLDTVVDDRIAYPDGSLRQLRLFETTFQMQWRFRRWWFLYRRGPLDQAWGRLTARFGSVVAALRTERGGSGLLPASGATLAPSTNPEDGILAIDARRLPLAGEASALHLEHLRAGHAVFVRGDRASLAVIVGVEVSQGGRARLRTLPLRVSLTSTTPRAPVPGSPGIVGTPSFARGPGGVVEAELHRARFLDRPQDGGVLEQLVSLWSQLCLLLGTDTADARCGGAFPAGLPRHTWLAADLSTEGDGVRALIAEADVPEAAWDDRDPNRCVVARRGELLLVRGQDERGMWWQAVAEVQSVKVMARAKAEAAPGTASPDVPVCCGGHGDTVVIELAGLRFPQPLVEGTIFVGRDFRGFGAATLACREPLPAPIDPQNAPAAWPQHGGEKVNRLPELHYALTVLDRFLGTGP